MRQSRQKIVELIIKSDYEGFVEELDSMTHEEYRVIDNYDLNFVLRVAKSGRVKYIEAVLADIKKKKIKYDDWSCKGKVIEKLILNKIKYLFDFLDVAPIEVNFKNASAISYIPTNKELRGGLLN